MSKINNYIIHSDFPTLANDDNGDMTLTIPNNYAVTSGNTGTIQSTKAIGSKDTSIRARMTRDGSNWYVGTALTFPITARVDGVSGTFQLYITVYIERTNSTTLRIFTNILNQNPTTLRVSGAVTVNARISTFKTPFN